MTHVLDKASAPSPGSAGPLRVLLVEDSIADANLIQRQLERAGYDVTADVVEDAEGFAARLGAQPYDIIIADYNLPQWTGMAALLALKESGKDIPFILVTGSLGDELAVECLKAGAADYVLKDRLARLPMAVLGALKEKAMRAERRQAERERARLAAAIEQSNDSVVITNAKGEIEYVNPAFTALSGYSRKEALGRNPKFLKSGKHDQSFYQHLWNTVLGGEIWQGEITNRKRDGSLYTQRTTITPVRDGAREIANFIAICDDVTERRKLEEQLRQAQKMEAIGQLAGGVAHDFNNLLMVIRGYTELMMDKLGPDHILRRNAQHVMQASEQASTLVRQLLAFSRNQVLAPKVLDLNQVVGEVGRMLRRLIGENVRFNVIAGENLGRVKVDPGQIEQVLLNLAVNARDAMPEGGDLIIETSNTVLDGAYARRDGSAETGAYVLLAVSDNGAGMDEETMSRIFEPFFTTKEQGEGTGLGLATVYGIVKQSGGNIFVYSEPGCGTTFKIYLPRVEAELDHAAAKTPAKSAHRATETVLLVEDEEGVRRVSREFLETRGYTVLEAASGEEALDMIRQHQGAIHAVLTDMIMPGMNGRSFVEQLRIQRPEIKVLFMSGYTEKGMSSSDLLVPGSAFLEKPFHGDDLAKKMRELLSGNHPP